QQDLSLIRPGQSATIITPAGPAPVQGTVTAVSPTGDPASLTFNVTVEPSSVPSWLRPGESAALDIVTSTPTSAVLVPVSAVVSINGTPQVFTITSSHTVALQDVTPSLSDGTTTVIQGLAAGTEVVAVGQTYLAPADKVRVTSTIAVPTSVVGSAVGGLLSPASSTTSPTSAGGSGGTAGSAGAPGAGAGKGAGGGGGKAGGAGS
ncbi:MAG: efflux RND transporter periplasmic adaptor subunit, partial [Acidimicrobiales bacterium]